MRKVFFSFHYMLDSVRVAQIRHSHTVTSGFETPPFYDAANWEEAKRRVGGVKNWIDSQLKGTSVTVVLIGEQTLDRPWVKYEIEQSEKKGNGIIGVTLEGMNVPFGIKPCRPVLKSPFGNGLLSSRYRHYSWMQDAGRDNIKSWIDEAALSKSLPTRLKLI